MTVAANRYAGRYVGTPRIALCSKKEKSGNKTYFWKAWWGVGAHRKFTSYAVSKWGYSASKKLALAASLKECRV